MQMFGPDSRSGLNRYVLCFPLCIVAILVLAAPLFFSPVNLFNLVSQAAPLFLAAMGQLFVALVAGIDLSVGSVISMTTAIVASQDGSPIGIVYAVLAGAAVGGANGFIVAVLRVHPIIATLSTMIFVQGVALLWLPAAGGTVPSVIASAVNGSLFGLPGTFYLIVAVFVLLTLLLQRSRFGLHLYAVGANPLNSRMNGLPDTRIIIAAYMISSLLAVMAGLVLAGRIGSGDPIIGEAFTLNSVTAVSLGGAQFSGGIGSPAGVLSGVLALVLMRNGMNLAGVDPFLQSALTGLLLLIAISFQRRNTMGF